MQISSDIDQNFFSFCDALANFPSNISQILTIRRHSFGIWRLSQLSGRKYRERGKIKCDPRKQYRPVSVTKPFRREECLGSGSVYSVFFQHLLWCVIAFSDRTRVHLFSMLLVWFRSVNISEATLTDSSQRNQIHATLFRPQCFLSDLPDFYTGMLVSFALRFIIFISFRLIQKWFSRTNNYATQQILVFSRLHTPVFNFY